MKITALPGTLSTTDNQNLFLVLPSQNIDRIIEKIIFAFHVLDVTDVNDRILNAAVALIDIELQDNNSTSFNMFDPNLMIYSGAGRVVWQHHISASGVDCGNHVEIELNYKILAGQSMTILMPWIGKYKVSTATGSIQSGVRSISVIGKNVESVLARKPQTEEMGLR